MTAESGKPINESKGEVAYGNAFVEWFAEEARRVYGEIVPSPTPNREIIVMKQPIGVAALDYPLELPDGYDYEKGRSCSGGRMYSGSEALRGHTTHRVGGGQIGSGCRHSKGRD